MDATLALWFDAARKGDLTQIQSLLDSGIDINATADAKRIETAINLAAYNGHAEIVELLLHCGANPFIHYSPAHWAWSWPSRQQVHQPVIDVVRKHFELMPMIRDAGPIGVSTEDYSLTRMQIKTVQPIRVATNSTGILDGPKDIYPAYSEIYPKLDKALADCNCPPIGGNIFDYRFVNGNSGPFRLHNCWPISPEGTVSGEGIETTDLPAIRCASLLLRGAWQNIGAAWKALSEQINAKGLTKAGSFREHYHLSVGPGSKDCITEVQHQIEA